MKNDNYLLKSIVATAGAVGALYLADNPRIVRHLIGALSSGQAEEKQPEQKANDHGTPEIHLRRILKELSARLGDAEVAIRQVRAGVKILTGHYNKGNDNDEEE